MFLTDQCFVLVLFIFTVPFFSASNLQQTEREHCSLHISQFVFILQSFSLSFLVKKGIRKLTSTLASPDTYKVVDALVDALTSQRPQTRYAVGFDAKLFNFISFLPTSIADRVLPH